MKRARAIVGVTGIALLAACGSLGDDSSMPKRDGGDGTGGTSATTTTGTNSTTSGTSTSAGSSTTAGASTSSSSVGTGSGGNATTTGPSTTTGNAGTTGSSAGGSGGSGGTAGSGGAGGRGGMGGGGRDGGAGTSGGSSGAGGAPKDAGVDARGGAGGSAGAGGNGGSSGSGGTAGAGGSSGATYIKHFVTFYGWPDNDPPGNAISYPQIHSGAGGVGSFTDPITFASATAEWAPGTKLYVPFLKRYVIMEDLCAQCTTDWSSGKYHIDIWIDSDGHLDNQVIQCEDSLTQTSADVEVNPPNGRPVDTTPLFNPNTGVCWQ